MFAQTVHVSHANSYFRTQSNAVSLVRVTADAGSTLTLGFNSDPNFTVTRINAPAAWTCNLGARTCSRPDSGAAVFEFLQFIGTIHESAPATITNSATLNGSLIASDTTPVYAPSKVIQWGGPGPAMRNNLPTSANLVAVAVGEAHLVGLSLDGTLIPWGATNVGQQSNLPTESRFLAVAASLVDSVGLKSDGSVAIWGQTGGGQTNGLPTGTGFIAVANSRLFSVALTNEGRIVTWGRPPNRNELPTTNEFVAIAAGNAHFVALRADGSVAMWGENTRNQRLNLPTGSGFTAIAASSDNSFALRADGTIVGWGPTPSTSLNGIPTEGVVQVAGYSFHGAVGAMRTDGSIAVSANVDFLGTGLPTAGGFALGSLGIGGAGVALLPLANPTANAGDNQATLISTAFPTPLSVRVLDVQGNPAEGIPITFTAPGTGASGTFSNSTTIITVNTDSSGIASAGVFTANSSAGRYDVTASYPGLPAVRLGLTNLNPLAVTGVFDSNNSPLLPLYPAGTGILNANFNQPISNGADAGNFRLVSRNVDGEDPQSTSCTALAPGDLDVPLTNVTYHSSLNLSSVTFPMASGARFKLLICAVNRVNPINSLRSASGDSSLSADYSGPVFATTPILAASGFARSTTSVTMALNAPPVASTVNANSVKLFAGLIGDASCSTVGTAVPGTASISGNSIVFTPTNPLGVGRYTLVLCGTVRGGNGGFLGTSNLGQSGSDRVALFSITPPTPSSLDKTAGDAQSGVVGTSFATNLSVTAGLNSLPFIGAQVTFTAVPGPDGGTATFAPTPAQPIVTGADGIATAPALTPTVPGAFTVIASVLGNSLIQTFSLSSCSSSPVVTSTADSGAGSLRSAVGGVCPGGTITFDPLVFATPQTITLASRILLNKSLTIQGPANGSVTISGNDATRIFFIGSGSLAPFTGTVNLNGLTLTNGLGRGGDANFGGKAPGMGGAIFQNSGSVSLTNVSFRSNRATGGSQDNAVGFAGAGFGGNASGDVGTGGGDLGGLGTAAGVSGAAGDGAGGGGHPLTRGSAGGFGGGGGGSSAGGGAGGFGAGGGTGAAPGWGASASAGSAGGAGAGFGGAVFVRSGSMSLTNVSFAGNSVLGGTLPTGRTAQAKGGALFLYSGATVTANGVSFFNSTAASAGLPGTGNSAAPYTTGATCPGVDNVDVCGTISGNRLTVTVSGSGTVTGGGLNCPAEGCSTLSTGSVTLTATPAAGSVLTGWSGGGCSGTGLTCTVSLASANQTVTATFGLPTQPVTINVPAGISYTFNGQTVTGTQTFNVVPGTYALSTPPTPQALGVGSRAVFASWSNGQPSSHDVTVGSAAVSITGTFTTQFQLTTAAAPSNGGAVTPASGTFYDSGTVVNLTATPGSGFVFGSWTGPVSNTNTVTMTAPQSITANFTAQTGVTINVPAGVSYTFNGQTVSGTQTFNVAPGTYALSTPPTPQALGVGSRAVFASWSNGQPRSHDVTVGSAAVSITGNFTTQFQLTTAASPSNGGAVTPSSGTFYDSGTVVNVSATPNSGFVFSSWTGPVSNTNTVTMTAPQSITANFTAQTGVTINVPAGISYTFNGQTVSGTQTFNVAPGTYALSTPPTPQALGVGSRAVFASWSNGQPRSHDVTVGSAAVSITGNFTTQFQLTTAAAPSNGGAVTPSSGTFYDSGTVVNVSATPNSGFVFSSWTGPVSNTNTVTMTAPQSITANFTAQTGVTINVPAGISYTFNGQTVSGTQTFNVAPGTYALSTPPTPQALGVGSRAVFASWSNGQPRSHDVTVGSAAVSITGNFTTQFQLTTAAAPSNGGAVTPSSGTFYDSGTVVNVSATPNSGFVFSSWTGPVSNTNTVTMTAPQSITANFTAQTGVTINVPAGVSYTFNGQTVSGTQTFNVAPGTYALSTTTPQVLGAGSRAVFASWSNGQPRSHDVTVGSAAVSITGNFTTQFQLTTAASPSNGGTVTPSSGTFYDSGTVVNVSATPNSGFVFSSWTGPVSNTNTVTMTAPQSITANFTAQTGVTINVPAGISYTFNGQTVTGTQTFNVAPGTYALSTTTPQVLGAGSRAVFASWSNGQPRSHDVTVGSAAVSITGTFTTQFQLTTAAAPSNGGAVTPSSGTFYDSGTVVNVSATPNSGFVFANWTGAVASTNSAATTVTMDAAKSVTANFTAQTGVTINVPAGVSYTFNGQTVSGTQTFNVAPGTYTLSTTTPQALGAGSRAVFASWSNGQPISHNVTVGSTAVSIIGSFTTQFQLTTAASPSNGGTVTPASGTFYDAGTVVNLSATPNSGFGFGSWTGAVANSSAASTTVTMDAAKSVTGNFTAQTGVTINVPAGISYTFNGQTVTGSQMFNVAPGTYTLSTTTPQALGAGSRAVFASWSNGQPISHSVTVGSTAVSISGTFTTQFQLTTAAGTGGTVQPASGNFYDSGTVVTVSATPSSGFVFGSWTGPVSNTNTVTMNAPQSITANFTAIVGAPNVTSQLSITGGVLAFSRATNRYTQTVTVTNNGSALTSAAYVLDNLAAGYTLIQPSGSTAFTSPVGSPYREIGALGTGGSVTFTVEFTRVGTPAFSYTPRILGVGSR
jgi:hypothetical protein